MRAADSSRLAIGRPAGALAQAAAAERSWLMSASGEEETSEAASSIIGDAEREWQSEKTLGGTQPFPTSVINNLTHTHTYGNRYLGPYCSLRRRMLPLPRRESTPVLLAAAAATLLTCSVPTLPAAAKTPPPPTWGPFVGMSPEQMDELNTLSQQPSAGFLLPSGVRVIDLVLGTGPQPRIGTRVYCNYKVWAHGFRNGPVADWSFMDGRPHDWLLGSADAQIPTAVDSGVVGMREGGWRRLVVPNAYGGAGLRRVAPLRGGGRFTPPKAGYAILPGATAYFDLIMLDGGSGRCVSELSPPGLPVPEARKLRSLTCIPGSASESFSMGG